MRTRSYLSRWLTVMLWLMAAAAVAYAVLSVVALAVGGPWPALVLLCAWFVGLAVTFRGLRSESRRVDAAFVQRGWRV